MPRVLPYLLLLALVLGLVATPGGRALDHDLVDRATALDRAHSALDVTMRFGAALGTHTVVLSGLLMPAAFGGEVARATVRAATVAAIGNSFATTAIRSVVNRTRPNGHRNRPRSSFPSGHASGAAAVVQVVSRRHPKRGRWLWLLVAWIAVSRVFLDVHYPSDVLAGILVGAVVGAFVLRFQVILGGAVAAAPAAPSSRPLEL